MSGLPVLDGGGLDCRRALAPGVAFGDEGPPDYGGDQSHHA
nr:hypothetical protein [Frankia sp. CeD]